jgi:multicomponent K+:H+ antiporter subunit E
MKLLPAPLSSLVLLVLWLAMNGSVSFGQVLLGLALAIAIPLLLAPIRGQRARPAHPWLALRLLGTVLVDIVTSNIEVARRILGPESNIKPGFVWFPLAIRDPHGVATLAGIITMTPGTLSAQLSPDERHLLIHVLNLCDEPALIESIRLRYEAPLIRIFEDRAPDSHRPEEDEC